MNNTFSTYKEEQTQLVIRELRRHLQEQPQLLRRCDFLPYLSYYVNFTLPQYNIKGRKRKRVQKDPKTITLFL